MEILDLNGWEKFMNLNKEITDITIKLKRNKIPQGKKEKLIFRRNYLQKVVVPKTMKMLEP